MNMIQTIILHFISKHMLLFFVDNLHFAETRLMEQSFTLIQQSGTSDKKLAFEHNKLDL